MPTDLAALGILEERLRFLSSQIIHHANHVRESADGLKVGGHQASSASMSAIMAALYFDALGPNGALEHAALVTGLKHYLGPFEAYAKGDVPLTPFREEQGRQPVDNFYYEQEDRLFDAARQYDFNWSVHRPHTVNLVGCSLLTPNICSSMHVHKEWPFTICMRIIISEFIATSLRALSCPVAEESHRQKASRKLLVAHRFACFA